MELTAATGDRAAILARIADGFMAGEGLPCSWDLPGCRSVMAALDPPPPAESREVVFTAEWPGITIVCTRSLAGYSLEGGLHRDAR